MVPVGIPNALGEQLIDVVSPPIIAKTSDPTAGLGMEVSLNDVFQREVLILSQSISESDTVNLNLVGLVDPHKLYLSTPYILERLNGYSAITFGLKLKVKMVVPGSSYGLYNVQFLCEGGCQDIQGNTTTQRDSATYDHYSTSTQDVHGFLNAEFSNTLEFEIPWECAYDSLYISDITNALTASPNCWRLLIWALSPLQSTIAATCAGSIKVYAQMAPGYKLLNASFQGKKVPRSPAEKEEIYPTAAKTEKKKYSDIGSKVAGGLGMLSAAFPAIAPFAGPAAAGLATISSFAASLGFTKEADPQVPQVTIHRLGSSMATVDGSDTAEVVGLYASNATTIDPAPGGGEAEDPAAFGPLFERWTIIDNFTIDTASTGKVRQIPVSPFVAGALLGVRYLQPAGYCGLPFARWRGDMEYMIYIPSSSNIKGSLQILWDPNTSNNLATAYPTDPTHRLANVIVDLEGSSRTELSVGYSRPQPSLGCSVKAATDAPSYWADNGKLTFYVPTPLTTTKGTGAIHIIVMARAKGNMKFMQPRYYLGEDGAASYPLVPNVIYQTEENDLPAVSNVQLVPDSPPYPTAELLSGEVFESARPFFQKYSRVCSNNVTLPITVSMVHKHPVPTTTNWSSEGDAALWNWAYHYLSIFSGWSGSVRYKFVPIYAATENTCTVRSFPVNGKFDSVVTVDQATHFDMQEARAGGAVEICMPYYGTVKHINPRMLNPSAAYYRNNGLRDDVFMFRGLTTDLTYDLHIAGGSDTRVTRFRRIPALSFGTTI